MDGGGGLVGGGLAAGAHALLPSLACPHCTAHLGHESGRSQPNAKWHQGQGGGCRGRARAEKG